MAYSMFSFLSEKKDVNQNVQQNGTVPYQPKVNGVNGGGLKPPQIFQTIPEVEYNDETTVSTVSGNGIANENYLRVSFAKKERKVSEISRNGKGQRDSVYDDNLPQLQRGHVNSVRSSAHGSINSLPVIREQYCCCTRWTKLEKYLITAIAILALVIIGLVIAVGVLADNNGTRNNFYWKL